MKRPLLILLAVAGYSLLETGLLLSVIVPRQFAFPSPDAYDMAVGLGQLVLVPGLAVLFSRIIYGPRKLGRRALVALFIGPLTVCLFIATLVALALIFEWTFVISKILLATAAVVLLVLMAMALRWCIHKSRIWNLDAEAERWLAERRAGISLSERAWRNRRVRFAVCIPSIVVLAVFLFLPEVWGLLSHLGGHGLGNLSGYRVTIPPTWFVWNSFNGESSGNSQAFGFAARGIALGSNPFRYDALSSWDIRTTGFNSGFVPGYDRALPKDNEIISRQNFAIEGGNIVCTDYWPSDWHRPRSDAATIAYVICTDTRRLRAGFMGDRSQLPTFYRMINSIKPTR